jgi:cysteine-rich repeat protein
MTIYFNPESGRAPVTVPCASGDYSCQARYVCVAVTGETCAWQSYECSGANYGSWYPPSQGGVAAFAVAYAYETSGSVGNICSSSHSWLLSNYGFTAWQNDSAYWVRDGQGGPCGDGYIDTGIGETCDDGNTVSEDGCSSSCTTE